MRTPPSKSSCPRRWPLRATRPAASACATTHFRHASSSRRARASTNGRMRIAATLSPSSRCGLLDFSPTRPPAQPPRMHFADMPCRHARPQRCAQRQGLSTAAFRHCLRIAPGRGTPGCVGRLIGSTLSASTPRTERHRRSCMHVCHAGAESQRARARRAAQHGLRPPGHQAGQHPAPAKAARLDAHRLWLRSSHRCFPSALPSGPDCTRVKRAQLERNTAACYTQFMHCVCTTMVALAPPPPPARRSFGLPMHALPMFPSTHTLSPGTCQGPPVPAAGTAWHQRLKHGGNQAC